MIFLTPDDAGYGPAREVYNAGILTQPKRIAMCATEAGVRQALQRAKAADFHAEELEGYVLGLLVQGIGGDEQDALGSHEEGADDFDPCFAKASGPREDCVLGRPIFTVSEAIL